MMKVVVQKNGQDGWFWHIVGGNGEIIASSQAYANKSNCMKSARLIAHHRDGFQLVVED